MKELQADSFTLLLATVNACAHTLRKHTLCLYVCIEATCHQHFAMCVVSCNNQPAAHVCAK